MLPLGSINADFQFRVARRPEISETMIEREFKRSGGGKAANVAYFVRRFDRNAMVLGCVGDDDLAEQALRPLRDIGVDISGVRKVAGAASGLAMIMVPPDGKEGIVFAPNANMSWTDKDAASVAHAIHAAPVGTVLVMDCGIPLHVLELAAAAAGNSRHVVILDPSPAERVSDALIGAASIVVPNALEAEQQTGIKCNEVRGATEAGMWLLDRGAAAACIKLPEGGCVLVESQQVTCIDSIPIAVVDTTGADDAFAAALAVALTEHYSLTEAATLAVAASHLAVTAYGAQAAPLTWELLQQMAMRLDLRTSARQAS